MPLMGNSALTYRPDIRVKHSARRSGNLAGNRGHGIPPQGDIASRKLRIITDRHSLAMILLLSLEADALREMDPNDETKRFQNNAGNLLRQLYATVFRQGKLF